MKLLSVIIRVTLIAMVVLTPWMFGGVWARTQWALLLITSVLLAADLLSRFGKYDQTSWMPTSWLPLLFGIAIGVAQLVPMSTSWANMLAPESSAIRKQFDTPAVSPDQSKVDANFVVKINNSLNVGKSIIVTFIFHLKKGKWLRVSNIFLSLYFPKVIANP